MTIGLHPFLVWEPFDGPGETIAYGQFHARIGRLAGGLRHRGVARKHPMLDEVPVAFILPLESAPADLRDQIAAACAAQLADPNCGDASRRNSLRLDISVLDHASPFGVIAFDPLERLRGRKDGCVAAGGVDRIHAGLVGTRLGKRLRPACHHL